MTRKTHITVLKDEAVAALAIKPDAIIVDATLGSGGHAAAIQSKLSKKGTFIGIDADPTALQSNASLQETEACNVYLCEGNFRDIDHILGSLHISHVDGILADLGWRMEQFGGNEKGFSFLVDEPLVMTFGNPNTYPFIASDIVNTWDEKDIANVLKGYGEERYARRIAQGIARRREEKPILTTYELVDVIRQSVPATYRHGKIHPATRTFQALRIAVNDEFEALETFIKCAVQRLAPKGRLAIITFHSIEDRIVKHLFKQYTHDQYGTNVTKKPIVASPTERNSNPRSRSAKLRIFERT